MSNQAENANESQENVSQIKRRSSKKKKRMQPNIVTNLNQLNGPLSSISLPDDLTSKLNFISSDPAASNRLFTTVLMTKQSSLRINSGERFIEKSTYDALDVSTKFIIHCIII